MRWRKRAVKTGGVVVYRGVIGRCGGQFGYRLALVTTYDELAPAEARA